MVSKKNFHQHAGNGKAPYKKSYKQQGFQGNNTVSHNSNNMMFNTSQIPDNPGYMDFSNPTPPINGPNPTMQPQNNMPQQKKKNNKNKQKSKQVSPVPLQPPQNGNSNWRASKSPQQPPEPLMNKRRFSGPPIQSHGRGRMLPMVPPIPMGVPRPRNVMPRPMPMGRMPPPFLRAPVRAGAPYPPNFRGPHPMPIMGNPMMMPPRMPIGVPPMPLPNAMGKIKRPNTKIMKKTLKNKSTIKTLKNLINQYPLDKPFVTPEIRLEHDKKVDIENRLKGNRDDELFSQFKMQRDKFVSMYESAREEYLRQEAEAVKAKDAKDKQTINKTDAMDDTNSEAN